MNRGRVSSRISQLGSGTAFWAWVNAMVEFRQGIPDGISREDVEQSIRDFVADVGHNFGPSTRYDLVFEGKRYPPKATSTSEARKHRWGRCIAARRRKLVRYAG